SDVVNRPSAAPQAVPFLHPAGEPTIAALTSPFFLSVQHTAAFDFPQMDSLSHRSTSARQCFSGSRLVTLRSFSELLTHFLYCWCVWPGSVQPQVLSRSARTLSIDASSVHRASIQAATAGETDVRNRNPATIPAARCHSEKPFIEDL